MEVRDLHKKIELVLKEEVRSYSANGRIRGGLGSFNITLQSVPNSGWTTEGQIPQILFDKSDPTVISSPNANILFKLYSSLDHDGKVAMKSYLVSHLRDDSSYASVAYLIFFVLYRIGEPLEALKYTQRGLSDVHITNGKSNLLGMFSMVISREYLEISPDVYESARLILQSAPEYPFWLEPKINIALLRHLEKDLNDVNPEINVDRDRILEIWGRRFSSIEIPALIKEIEDSFRDGDFSDAKFATCIGRIRVLLVESSKQVALAVAKSKNDSSINTKSDDHHFFQYLKDKKVITDNEWNIIRGLYGMASDTGSHSSISKREYARLEKNMTYEIILLFLTKYGL
jgi:hypothetical protein